MPTLTIHLVEEVGLPVVAKVLLHVDDPKEHLLRNKIMRLFSMSLRGDLDTFLDSKNSESNRAAWDALTFHKRDVTITLVILPRATAAPVAPPPPPIPERERRCLSAVKEVLHTYRVKEDPPLPNDTLNPQAYRAAVEALGSQRAAQQRELTQLQQALDGFGGLPENRLFALGQLMDEVHQLREEKRALEDENEALKSEVANLKGRRASLDARTISAQNDLRRDQETLTPQQEESEGRDDPQSPARGRV